MTFPALSTGMRFDVMDLEPKGICPELDAARARLKAWHEKKLAEERAAISYAIAQARITGHIGRNYRQFRFGGQDGIPVTYEQVEI